MGSSHSGAWELTGEGAKVIGERGEPISGLTGARAVVWRLGNSDEAVQKWSLVVPVLELEGREKLEEEVR
jgi:hypothetical protein